jgi:uncharacterized cupin superfamily protein
LSREPCVRHYPTNSDGILVYAHAMSDPAPSRDANIVSTTADYEREQVSTTMVGRRAGAELLGASVYEIQPGGRQADLHFHYRNEELIIVLAGRPTMHTLDGSRELSTGEVVACLRGRRGAHRLENETDEIARVLIVSTNFMPEIVEYPERPNGGGVFVMTEAPYTDASLDEARGRIIRLFWRNDGLPIPPDAAAPQPAEASEPE